MGEKEFSIGIVNSDDGEVIAVRIGEDEFFIPAVSVLGPKGSLFLDDYQYFDWDSDPNLTDYLRIRWCGNVFSVEGQLSMVIHSDRKFLTMRVHTFEVEVDDIPGIESYLNPSDRDGYLESISEEPGYYDPGVGRPAKVK